MTSESTGNPLAMIGKATDDLIVADILIHTQKEDKFVHWYVTAKTTN